MCVHRNDISDSELRDIDTQGALRSITGFDRDAQDAATDLIDGLGARGISTVNDADALTDTVDGLTASEVEDLLVSYDSYRRADFDGARSPRAIQDDLDQLADPDDGDESVDGIARMIRERTGSGDAGNFRGVDGAVQVAAEKIDEGVDPNDLHLERDIDIDKRDVVRETGLSSQDLFKETDIDVDVDGGSSTEIKKTDFEPFADKGFANRARAKELGDLWQKLNTVAAYKDSGSITVTVSRASDEPFSEGVLRELRSSNNNIETGTLNVEDVSSLRNLGDQVESEFEIDIIFRRFDRGE